MKYTGITIGPIITTLAQVRKPRHLWSASYMFSHLMNNILNTDEAKKGTLISPAKLTADDSKIGIGLYPDRAFFFGEININIMTIEALGKLSLEIDIPVDDLNNYFNILGLQIEANTEADAIDKLNHKLDILELCNRCEESGSRQKILDLISNTESSPLFEVGWGRPDFPINSLGEIASISLKSIDEKKWLNASRLERASSDQIKKLIDEDIFYRKLKDDFTKSIRSYHKYFCVVQADGDRMGEVIKNLKEGKLSEFSGKLLEFGKAASQIISNFGGIPIYAGGDDLLFIAPVISVQGKYNIFNLIDRIDDQYNTIIRNNADILLKEGHTQKTSMSYGVFISYYKYPLYEALNAARSLLFNEAKLQRNSISCELYKHSGSSFKAFLFKSDKKENETEWVKEKVKEKFEELLDYAIPENMVSVTSHKLRANAVLWQVTKGDKVRLEAFFRKIMDEEEKTKEKVSYLTIVRELLYELIIQKKKILASSASKKKDDLEKIIKWLDDNIYAMLRIAKFINGEDLKDE